MHPAPRSIQKTTAAHTASPTLAPQETSRGGPSTVADAHPAATAAKHRDVRSTDVCAGLSIFRLTLGLLVLVAFGLRAYHLDAQSLWYDEGVTAELARLDLVQLTRWTAQDIQPPLYYYLMAGWGRLAGWSEWSLRFPSVFFGTLLIPLMAALAHALTRRRAASILAALLTAAHPLLLYYSQEARMYAMLTLLTVALAYYLLAHRAINPRPRASLLYWAGYVLLAAAAVYTHYFAFFFIGALGIMFLLDLLFFRRVTGQASPALPETAQSLSEPRGRSFILAHFVLLLVYAPWLSAMLGQLSTDASYWEGEFKLDEAVRHVANHFTSGETMAEAQATQLLYVFGALSAIAIVALLFAGVFARRALLVSLLWLLLPVAGILGLAQLVPKFNPRYAMIALPGLLLLWATGLGYIFPAAARRTRAGLGIPTVLIRRLSAALLTVFLLGVFTFSNYNWFTDLAYTKAEWRQLSDYIRNRIAAKTANAPQAANTDLVILVSGHTWPVWNYYAPDMPALRLPDLEILDVNAILDFANTAHPLRKALRNMEDVWLVQWQDEIVDPMQIVPLQLQLAGEQRRVNSQFWHLKLAHYTEIDAEAVLVEPTGISESSFNFGGQVYLLDYTVAENGDLLLFWQLHPDFEDTPGDLRMAAQLFTEEGLPFFRLIDRRPTGFDYPVFRWQQRQITLGRIPAAAWAGPGALPGSYRMRLGVYDIDGDLSGLDVLGSGGQPLGKHAILDLTLPIATAGQEDMDRVAFAALVEDLWLEVATDTEQAEPGQAITAELHWVADAPPAHDFDLQLRWRLRSNDEIIGEQTRAITPLPAQAWPTAQLLRTLHQWRPPLHLPPDDYWLEIGTTLADSEYIRLPMRILGSTRRYAPPAYAAPVDQVFAEQLHLLGVIEPLTFQPRAGGQVALTLVWQAAELMADDYTVTVQWLGLDNRLASQIDLPLPGGSSNWLSGQVELQSVIVNVPETSGTYRLVAAVYNPNAPELPRLLTRDGEDLIELASLTVVD